MIKKRVRSGTVKHLADDEFRGCASDLLLCIEIATNTLSNHSQDISCEARRLIKAAADRAANALFRLTVGQR